MFHTDERLPFRAQVGTMRTVTQITPEAKMVDRQAWEQPQPYRAETLADAEGDGAARHRGVGQARGAVAWTDRPPPRHLQPDWNDPSRAAHTQARPDSRDAWA